MFPTGIGLPMTTLVFVSITKTISLAELVTYILSFTGSYAIPDGEDPNPVIVSTVTSHVVGVGGGVEDIITSLSSLLMQIKANSFLLS
jgi:hypothetical protein